MTGSSRQKSQSIGLEEAIGFLRESCLVTEMGGKTALTNKGETFLRVFKEFRKGQSGSSSSGAIPYDGLSSSVGARQS